MDTVKVTSYVFGSVVASAILEAVFAALWLTGAIMLGASIADNAGWVDFSADLRTTFALSLVLQLWRAPSIVLRALAGLNSPS